MVAVSGGVDSMVLLDVLRSQPGMELVVAHFEHGIREDSDQDRQLVEATAKQYELPFVCEHGRLGAHPSEAAARDARYAFLRRVARDVQAAAIVTAHHQDDLLETAVLNLVRGTGRKGLSSLASGGDIQRPLLQTSKAAIKQYALQHAIAWHEDSTNRDDTYARNYIRHTILPRLGQEGRAQLLAHLQKAADTNPVIDELLMADLSRHHSDDGIDRAWFIMLPYDVSCEVMAAWLRSHGVREFNRKGIERLVVVSKVSQPGKQFDVNAGYLLKVGRRTLRLCDRSSS